jgi:molecular chaperone GrpE
MSENDLNHNLSLDPDQPGAASGGQPAEGGEATLESQPSDLAAPLTPEEIEALRAKAAKADENYDRLLRVSADFDNYKKRAARERLDAIKYANENLLERLVPVLDTFDMAMQAVNSPQGASMDALKTGVSMIHSQLKGVLSDAGLQELDASGQKFDPNLHEAVSHQESADVPEGNVLQQLRRGYKLQGKLIRPATVIVARKAGS